MIEAANIPSGETYISAIWNHAESPKALMVLAHGAGAGMDHSFMSSLASQLCEAGISVLRFNFPYIDLGRRAPDSPKKAQNAIADVVNFASQSYPDLPLFVGGKSYGGRMASHCAAQKSIDSVKGLVFYGFPLHAPGRDSKDRANHLSEVNIPMLFLQGAKDKLANIDLITEVCAELGGKAQLEVFESADHSFKVPKKMSIDQEQMIGLLVEKTRKWIYTSTSSV